MLIAYPSNGRFLESGNCEFHDSVTWKIIAFWDNRLPPVTRGTRPTSRTSLLPYLPLVQCNRLHQIGPLLRYRPHLELVKKARAYEDSERLVGEQPIWLNPLP